MESSSAAAWTTQMDRITVLEQDRSLLNLMTIIRDVNTNDRDFSAAVEKVVRRLITAGKYYSISNELLIIGTTAYVNV